MSADIGRQPVAGHAAHARADHLDADHQRIGEHHRPPELIAELRAGLRIRRNAARIVVGSAGDETRTEQPKQAARHARPCQRGTDAGVGADAQLERLQHVAVLRVLHEGDDGCRRPGFGRYGQRDFARCVARSGHRDASAQRADDVIVRQTNAGVLAGLDLGDEPAVGKGDEERGCSCDRFPRERWRWPSRQSRRVAPALRARSWHALAWRRQPRARAALVFPCQSGKS